MHLHTHMPYVSFWFMETWKGENSEQHTCFVIAEWCRLRFNTTDGSCSGANGSCCRRQVRVEFLAVNGWLPEYKCRSEEAAPQTRGVWLWFKLGHRGRSLLAVLWQYKEINICKGYWYMSSQWHGVRLDIIIIRDFKEILDRLIFQSVLVFLHLLFQNILNFNSYSSSFILHCVLCNSNTELVTWAHVMFPIDRHFCGLFQRLFLLQLAPFVCI